MATFVLVHGGGHGGWCWQRLAPLLRAAGHDVYTPTLTGLGERAHLLSPQVGLETHITDVGNVLAYGELRDVILVGHSYAGFVISAVADRVPQRIARLVLLDAAIPAPGESLMDASPGLRQFADADCRVVNGVALVLWPGPITQQIYGVGDEDWAWMAPRLTPHPLRCFEDKLLLSGAVAHVPRAIINCTGTLKMRQADSRYRQASTVWEIDAPHDLMITHSAAVADMLLMLT